MALEFLQPEIVDVKNQPRCCSMSYVATGVFVGVALTVLFGVAYYAGRQSANIDLQPTNQGSWNGIPGDRIHPDFLSASATHGGSNMAVCTASVDENAEGFFAIDFVTGDLKGWVYYPRMQKFGGLLMTNVQGVLGASKNPEYLLVSGGAASIPTGGNVKPASSLLYVVDMRSGMFAAYQIPWSRTQESSGQGQMSPFVFVDGGQIREPSSGIKKPIAPAGGAAAAGARKPDGKPADPKLEPKVDPKVDPKADPNKAKK